MAELEGVYEAMVALGSPDVQVSSAAAKWLDEFQKSIAAWSVSDRILGEARSFEACLFASQTIKRKILSSFRELPPTSYDQLRDSLIYQLQSLEQKLGRNSSTIITQLAAALADLYLQVPAWGDGFLGDLLERLTKGKSLNEVSGVVLTLLRVFPEELQSRHLRIGKNRRCAVEKALAEKTDTVVALLGQIASTLATADMQQQVKVISGLGSWMLNSQCPTDSIAKSPLLLSILHALSTSNCNMEVHDAATECVVNALYLVENVKVHRQLASVLQSGIYATLAAFKAAIAEEDQEKIQNYARVYSELCESLLPEIVSQPGSGFGDLKSMDMLLLVNDYHDYSIVETSFNMWYRLSEYLYQLDENEFDELRPTFQPYVKRLIQSLCRHCCLDGDMEGVLDAKSEIAEFRKKASETVKDVTFVVGSGQLLKEMIELLKSYASEGWEKMESTLFIISCFIHNISETEDTVIPHILNSIFSLPPSTHSMLLSTSAGLLGNLQDWLYYHPDYLVLTTQWLISLAVNTSLLRTLAESLECLCEKGHQHLHAYFDPLLQMSQQVEAGSIRGQEAEEASLCLLRAATHLLNDLPAAELVHRLQRLCLPRIQYLERISSLHPSVSATGVPEADKENELAFTNDVHLVLCIDGLAVIFRVLKPWQSQCAFAQLSAQLEAHPASAGHSPPVPWMELVARIWRSIAAVLDDYKANGRVVEHACRAIRFIIRSMGNQSVHFIEQLVALLIQIYNQHPHPCFLYLASILTDENGAIVDLQPGLVHMLKVLAERSFALIRDKDDLKNHPETVDDLFRLAIRFVQRAPAVFFREPISAALFQAAILGLEVEHEHANKSVTKFLSEVIDIATGRKGGDGGETFAAAAHKESSAAAEKLVVAHGQQLTSQCINAAVFHLSNIQRREVADLVYALKQLDRQKLIAWLGASVTNLPRDTGLAATSQQLSEFLDELIRADKSYMVANAIRDLSKHYS